MADTEQLGLTFQAPARKIYPVRELVAAVRTQVERAFTDIYVEGEISNYRPADSGHLYFTLKDGTAQLRGVMWRTQARLLRFRPENGAWLAALSLASTLYCTQASPTPPQFGSSSQDAPVPSGATVLSLKMNSVYFGW